MNFYSTWEATRNLCVDDHAFMISFLSSIPASTEILVSGTLEDIEAALSTLNQISIGEFISTIDTLDICNDLLPADVPCFSTFANAIVRINELLEFAEDGLTYAELGYQITSTPNLLAQIKYGENHAKLAAAMSLVSITTPHRPAKVTSTALGRYLVSLAYEEKERVLRRLLLRDRCIQLIVKDAVKGTANYRSIVKCLSDSTAYRRRTSVKCAVEFALGEPETQSLLDHIDWEL